MKLGDEIEYEGRVYNVMSVRATHNTSGHSIEIIAYEPLLATSLALEAQRKSELVRQGLEHMKSLEEK